MKKHVKVDQNYYLITQDATEKTTVVEQPKDVNHLLLVDVSGSMSYDLPEVRKNLKNKLSNLVKANDTVSIIWFSGNSQAGILKEEVAVHSAKQLTDLNDAIDKWLRPIGLTAFAKPLELAKDIITRISSTRPDSIFSLVFMSDGWNNNCSWESVIKALNQLAPVLSSSVMVEYGMYADSVRLTEMAGILGGEKISCAGFDEYDAVIGKTLSTALKGGKKVVVEITDPYLYDFAFSVSDDGSVILYNIVKEGVSFPQVMVNSDVKEIHFFSPRQVGETHVPETALYAAVYVLADKLLNDDAEKIFYALGDNFYYKQLLNAFGKQKLNTFKASILECVSDLSKRYPSGKAEIEKVPEDAYCLMNLIEDLGNIDGCLFYPNHPEFVYNRVGRKRVAVGDTLTDAQQKQLAEAKTVEEGTKLMAEFAKTNVKLKFEDTDRNAGYALTDLVWNEERANLSVRIKIDGKVILPDNEFKLTEVPSYRYNTYTLLKDGIVNVAKLPLSYTDELYKHLLEKGVDVTAVVDEANPYGGVKYLIINLNSVPIINKAMVKNISAKALAAQEWELLKLQGAKKVYDHYRKILFPKESKSYVETYGQDAADWLKGVGVTDYNGFSPKSEAEESTDFYMSVNLETKIKGSTLPKVEDVVAKLAKNSDVSLLPVGSQTMAPAILEYQKQVSDAQKLTEDERNKVLQAYIVGKSTELNKKKRAVMQEIAEIKFSLILSKRWFFEFKSFDENKISLTLDNQNLDYTFNLIEKEVKI